MRRKTVNLITLYQSVGAVLNIIALFVVLAISIEALEACLTMAALNGIYLLVSRDVARKHEQICSHKIYPDISMKQG